MGAFHFVRDILNHNKAAEAKNAALIENGEEPTEVPMKPIVVSFMFVKIIKTKLVRTTDTK
jgi:DNA polymerase-3 subunit alpha